VVLEDILFLHVSQKCGTQNFNDQTNGHSNVLFSLDRCLGNVLLWHHNPSAYVSKSTIEYEAFKKSISSFLFRDWNRVLHAWINDEW
jgi:hypothetical protein